ncbi:MAG: hypothetical protein A4E66_00164 [Syntrophus sp. PtaB.Bin001]|nr:MAG: hypothetical protein A4E66_00164 [Syntrophus sp. PtaB.Bin001]
MSEALIRAQIKAILEAVTGIGVVHDYKRYARSIADFRKIMTPTGGTGVNGWVVSRQKTASRQATMGPKGQIERTHIFSISGIYALDDAAGSETTFQETIDAIFEAFKANGTLNGTAISHQQIQVEDVDVTPESELGDDLYHTADLTLEVLERTAVS